MSNPKKDESPLINIIINVLLPVLALSYLSKDAGLVDDPKPYHIGPHKALLVAICIPLLYGIYHFITTKKCNLFSAIGLTSVLLTGGVTVYLWNPGGTVKPDAALWFGMKEALQPLILGGIMLASHWTKSPLFREFIYNPSLFDINKIENIVNEAGKEERYKTLLLRNTLLFCGSFLLSSILNLIVSFYFLGPLDFSASNAQELYNQGVARITGWGYLLIGVPLLLISALIVFKHTRDLKALTGLKTNEVLTITT